MNFYMNWKHERLTRHANVNWPTFSLDDTTNRTERVLSTSYKHISQTLSQGLTDQFVIKYEQKSVFRLINKISSIGF